MRQTIERMNFFWDNRFVIDKTDYLEKRLKLQQQLEKLTPAYDEFDRAIDLLKNFRQYWNECGKNIEKQNELIRLIVEKVYIEDSTRLSRLHTCGRKGT